MVPSTTRAVSSPSINELAPQVVAEDPLSVTPSPARATRANAVSTNGQIHDNNEQVCKESTELQQQLPTTSRAASYQLRAPKSIDETSVERAHVHEGNHTNLTTGLSPKTFNLSALSSELINETLNYFINCKDRMSQITRTFDDSDAYIMLLQEKEMDLELVAQMGQEMLKQLDEYKLQIESLHRENLQLKDDNQQLRYERASKERLLETLMQEEEHRHEQDTSFSSRNYYSTSIQSDDDQFSSLRSQPECVGGGGDLRRRLDELHEELLDRESKIQEQKSKIEQQSRELLDWRGKFKFLEYENETLRFSQKERQEEIELRERNFSEFLKIHYELVKSFVELQRESRASDSGCDISTSTSLSMDLNSDHKHVDCNSGDKSGASAHAGAVSNWFRFSSLTLIKFLLLLDWILLKV